MKCKKATPWTKIKAEYLNGVTPKELAAKYNIEAKKIHDKANKEEWTKEKTRIVENVRENIQEEIESLTKLALRELKAVLQDSDASYGDKIQASKVIVDISGLKTSKKEVEINKDPIMVEFI